MIKLNNLRIKTKLIYALLIYIQLYSCNDNLYNDYSNNAQSIYDSFWNEVDRNYSFFNYLNLDWDSIYTVYADNINDNTSDSLLFITFSNMLNHFNDAHLNIYAPQGIGGNINYFNKFQSNTIDDIQSYFSLYKTLNSCLQYGKISETELGYIKIKTFEGENNLFTKFDSIIDIFNNTKGLIIDIRSNKGGLISNASTVIKCLTDTTRIAFQYRYRNGEQHDDFSAWEKYILTPNETDRYNKNVVILTNRTTYSAAEWFVAMADALPQISIVGDTTGGGSGIPLLRELPNGWILRISNTQLKLPSGNDFQFYGICPDIPIWITEEEYNNNTDAILEKAISLLKE